MFKLEKAMERRNNKQSDTLNREGYYEAVREASMDRSNKSISLSPDMIRLVVWLIICSLWVMASYLNNMMLMDKVLVSGFIITCILIIRLVSERQANNIKY